MASSSLKSIAEAMNAIPDKKAHLLDSLQHLRSLSSSLSTFLLAFDDLDSHLSSIESSIQLRLDNLHSLQPSPNPNPTPPPRPEPEPEPEFDPRPELLDLCTAMDGPALLAFINDTHTDLKAIRAELPRALRAAPDRARLVLGAMSEFFSSPPPSKKKRGGTGRDARDYNRKNCVLLMERLAATKPEISAEVAEDAKKLAREFRAKLDGGVAQDTFLGFWGFLWLVAVYGVGSEFEVGVLLDAVVPVARRKQTTELCKALGIGDHIPTLIQKLIIQGKQLDAVHFVYAFNLVDRFPPVPLLKDYVKESKKVASEIRRKGNSSTQSRNEAVMKEISMLNAVIKAIEQHKLESEYPTEPLQKQVEKLEKMKPEKKRTATDGPAPSQINQQDMANKRPRASLGSSLEAAVFPPLQILLPPSLMTEQVPFLGSAGPYGLPRSSLYDRPGSSLLEPSMVRGQQLSPSKSYMYPLESRLLSGSYERPPAYDRPIGYDIPAAYDRPAAYERATTYQRSAGFGNYTLSGGLP